MKLRRYSEFINESYKSDTLPTLEEIGEYFQSIVDDCVEFSIRYISYFGVDGTTILTTNRPIGHVSYEVIGYRVSAILSKLCDFNYIKKELSHIEENINVDYPSIRCIINKFSDKYEKFNIAEISVSYKNDYLDNIVKCVEQNVNESISEDSFVVDIPKNIDEYFQPIFDLNTENEYVKEYLLQTESDTIHDAGGYEMKSYDYEKKPYKIIGYYLLFRFDPTQSEEDLEDEFRHIFYNIKTDYPNLCVYYSVLTSSLVNNISVAIYIMNKFNKEIYYGSIEYGNYILYNSKLNESVAEISGLKLIKKNKFLEYFQSLIDDGADVELGYKISYLQNGRWGRITYHDENDIQLDIQMEKNMERISLNNYQIDIDIDRDKMSNISFRKEIKHCFDNISIDTGLIYEIVEFYNLGDKTNAVISLYSRNVPT